MCEVGEEAVEHCRVLLDGVLDMLHNHSYILHEVTTVQGAQQLQHVSGQLRVALQSAVLRLFTLENAVLSLFTLIREY